MIKENEQNIEISEEEIPAKLTRHSEGSWRELLAISFPLMVAVLSGNLMIFFDRLILAKYSLDAMNAATAAGMISMIFSYGLLSIVSIGEFVVRQLNKSKQYTSAPEPVWQMIWFALFIWPLYYGLAEYSGPYLVSDYFYDDYGLPYFQWILYFGPSQAIQVALSTFFIGIGRTRLVFFTTIASNICNIILDILLIFGIEGVLDPMDTKGAAIATGISETIQVMLLFFPFLTKANRLLYHTHIPSFKPKLLFQCFRLACPTAIGNMIEVAAWSLIMQFMMALGTSHGTVVTIGLGFYSLIAFGIDGLYKGVYAIALNLIAAKKWEAVHRLWGSALKLLFAISSFIGILLVIYPETIIYEFLTLVPADEQPALAEIIKHTCLMLWIYFMIDGIVWIFTGILTAAGDTIFVMFINALSAWCFAFFPIYFFVHEVKGPPTMIWVLLNVYALIHAACFFYRYQSRSWQPSSLIFERQPS